MESLKNPELFQAKKALFEMDGYKVKGQKVMSQC